MIIIRDLPDTRYCEGCPCLYWDSSEDMDKGNLGYTIEYISSWTYMRPKKCFENHGE